MSSVDRRRFLRVTGSAAALAVAARGAVKPIRVGVFGTQHGHVRSKMRALRANSDYEVVAVHEPDEGARKQRQSQGLFAGLQFVSEDDLPRRRFSGPDHGRVPRLGSDSVGQQSD